MDGHRGIYPQDRWGASPGLGGMKTYTFKHGEMSYNIIEHIFNILFPARYDLVVVDLTYGKGRFYRKVRHRIETLIAVDILKHDWEVKPDMFYTMPCQEFVMKVLKGEIELSNIDMVVVDPPWNTRKRGLPTIPIGVLKMPYHMYVNPDNIIYAGMALAKRLNTLLLYRYKEPLKCNRIIDVKAEVKIFGMKGLVYYGVCSFSDG
jgi:hypothetical protein